MNGASEPLEDDTASLERLLAHERQYLDAARRDISDKTSVPVDPSITSPQRELCGIALSGGGMRSATFNLGLLQCLQQLGLLRMFDYLATVSGGGYIGGFWTAWRHYHPEARDSQGKAALFPTNCEFGARGARFAEVRHLREFSNFLSPRLGLMSLDTGRLVVATLGAVIPALFAAFSFLVLVLLVWSLLADLLLVGWGETDVPPGRELAFSCLLMTGVTCGLLLIWEWLHYQQRRRVMRNRGLPPAQPEEAHGRAGSRLMYSLSAILMSVGAVFLFWRPLIHAHHAQVHVFHGAWLQASASDLGWRGRLYIFDPALAWFGAVGTLVLLGWLTSRLAATRMQRPARAAVNRIISRLLLMAGVWTVLSAFWLAGRLLSDFILVNSQMRLTDLYRVMQTGLLATVTMLSACFAWMQRLFSKRTSRPVSPTSSHVLRARLPQLLAYGILGLSLLGAMLLILRAADDGWYLELWGGAAFLTVFTLVLFDLNLVGLHAFYRSRIARTFVGAAHGQGPGQTEPHPLDDVALDQLKPQPGPLHLFCCAANDLASIDPMANLYRGADSAVLSSVAFSVGPEWKGWKEIREEGGGVPTLASAMTASAAAVNSHMGSMSMRLGLAVTFLMTAFNLRLGLWWPHPTRARRRWYERLCVGLPFYKELIGRSRAQGRDVLLSDGAHFENLALYELVRRRCRFILVSDCGMDAQTSFDDFANAVRRVREDFGVEVRIDLSPLRPDPDTGLSRRTVVAGDVEYPDGSSGMLLLIKPSLVGNEPPDITQYKARNTEFPHETTGDQFYDEAQWEAYRRLGEHSALIAFRSVRQELEKDRAVAVASIFVRARAEWLPVPVGFEERFPRFVERSSALDQLLEAPGAQKLFREIFKEITELDRRAKSSSLVLDATEQAAALAADVKPTPEELANALHLIRRALLFMEEVFFTEDLAKYYNHPAYLGVLNYFARWGYAPLLRTWWPLLKTLHSPRFTHFMEERFALPGMERESVGQLSAVEEGFAMSCWLAQGGRKPRPHEHLFSYSLSLPHGQRHAYPIQAAQLLVRTHHGSPDDGGELVWPGGEGPPRRVVVWQGADFFVPPGLWGVGIGKDFLHLVTSSLEMPWPVEPGSVLAVRIQVSREDSVARQRRWADDLHLYGSEGFCEPSPALKHWLSDLEQELDRDLALPWVKRKNESWKSVWLTRLYQPVEAPARDDASPDPEPPSALH